MSGPAIFEINMDYIHNVQSLMAMASILTVIVTHTTKKPITVEECVTCGKMLLICILVSVCFVLLKRWLSKRDITYQTRALDRHTRNYKIGFGGITVVAIIGHLVLIFVHQRTIMVFYFLCICSCLSIMFLVLFVLPSTDYSCIVSSGFFLFLNVFLNFTLLFYNPYERDPTVFDEFDIFFCTFMSRFLLSMTTVPSISLFCDALLNRVQVIDYTTPEQQRIREVLRENNGDIGVIQREVKWKPTEETDDEEDNIKRYKELECKICFNQYNEKSTKRTPRTLTSCGHTLCHSCASQLDWFLAAVMCPFCRKLTNGSVHKLPINHAVLGLIKEIKAKRQ